jgi:hypothetical protein
MSSQVSEPKPATLSEALVGLTTLIVVIALLLMVGSCMFGGSGEQATQASPKAAPQAQSLSANAVTRPRDAASSDADGPDAATVSEAEGKIVDANDAGSGVYDVTCITDHHGHQAIYMVNSRTNDVAKIG